MPAVSTIDRSSIGVNDDGTGTTGTVINTAYIALAIYDKIDALLASNLSFSGVLTSSLASGSVKVTGLVVDYHSLSNSESDIGGIHIGMPFAKDVAPSGGYGTIKFFSLNAFSPEAYLQGTISLQTDPTPANRRFKIECIEQGTAYRNITLNEGGGNVGIGIIAPTVQFHIQSATNNVAYIEMIRLEGSTLGNGWERGITFTGNNGTYEVSRITAFLNNAERHLRLTVAGVQVMALRETGCVGVGLTAPTATIHVKAGVAAAAGAPIKLTPGVNLTVKEDGAFEYDGTHLYFTIGTTRNTLI